MGINAEYMGILKNAFGTDWSKGLKILYVGDDVTDEDVKKALKGLAVSFRVADSNLTQTSADQRLPDIQSVVSLLLWVEDFLQRGECVVPEGAIAVVDSMDSLVGEKKTA